MGRGQEQLLLIMNGNSDPTSFLNWGSWFEKEFKPRIGDRYFTFKTALNILLQNNGNTIVETGTIRSEGWVLGDGWSTYLFGKFCNRFGKRLYTVDISPEAIKISKKITREFKNSITYVTSGSVEFLESFKEKIDLLYLDSLDCSIEGDATGAQVHQLRELSSAIPKLSDNAIILLDDNNFANGGKTRLAKNYLFRHGFTLLADDQQSLWIKRSWRAKIFSLLVGWRDFLFPIGTARRRLYLRSIGRNPNPTPPQV